MTMTTIRVDRSLRDQINEIATERGTTAGAVINTLLKEQLERELTADLKRKMDSMSTQEQADDNAEVAQWDSLTSNGLKEYEGEWDEEWQRVLAQNATTLPNIVNN